MTWSAPLAFGRSQEQVEAMMEQGTTFSDVEYAGVFEWQPDADNIYLTSGIDNLALHRAESDQEDVGASDVGGGALDHLGLIVRAAEDVDRWAAFLEAQGVTLDAQPKTHRDGARSCYFRDPDGNRVQIIHHPPISDKT